MMDLSNKIIVVTGGAGLLGKQICEKLKQLNATVISVDIQYKNNDLHHKNIDITDPASVGSVINEIISEHNRIDGWINNAYPRTSDWHLKIEDIPFESWRKNIDMHLNGYFLCSQVVLAKMKTQGSGSLINMSSIYGVVGPDFSLYEGTKMTMPAAYAAIKGGIVNLTRYLAAYFGEYNISVNSVSPGGIFDNQPESFVKKYTDKVPLKRMGTPEDISGAVAFLLSDEAKYISGQNLIVDGGFTAI